MLPDATCTISSSASIADSTATFYVGQSQTWSGYLNGALDEVRIIKGQARYTSNFTVPAAEFPNQNQSAGASEKATACSGF